LENLLPNQAIVKQLAKCHFKSPYYDYERHISSIYNCDSKDEDVLDSGYCIFHDEYHLRDYLFTRYLEKKFIDKVKDSIIDNRALYCIGYYLPNITIEGKFNKPIYFTKCKFQGNAEFLGAIFQNTVVFDSAKFFVGANFRSATFSGRANFSNAEFHGGQANFYKAEFSGQIARFSFAKFFVGANFKSATFSGLTYFDSAEFPIRVYFNSATFSGQLVDFSKAKFSLRSFFNSATFSEKAYFDEATFSGVANFDEADFVGEAYFGLAEFSEKASFDSAKFAEKANFSKILIKDKAYFNYVLFADGRKILFGEIEDLSNFSFANTDITRVRFSDKASWGKGKKDKDRFKVIEEEILENSSAYSESLKYLFNLEDILKEDENREIHFYDNKNLLQIKLCKENKDNIAIVRNNNDNKEFTFVIKRDKNKIEVYPSKLEFSLGSVMAVYRNLRENYEFRLRYDEAGQFFIREMELKRNYRQVRPKNYTSDIYQLTLIR
jgi:uncharacterized protein YjbI with pentapeptide repeats